MMSPRTRHAILFKSGLSVVALLMTLVIAEAIARSAAPQVLAVPWQDQVSGVSAPRPNIEGRLRVPGAFAVRLTVGPQLFRGQDSFDETAPEGVVRLALLGDSTTFGVGAGDDDTYPARLERDLTARRTFGAVEIINAGNPGSGTGKRSAVVRRWVTASIPPSSF